MSSTKTVLFVCTGNTCRSPMAEGLLRAALQEVSEIAGRVQVVSAGVAAMPGQRMSRETEQILQSKGAAVKGFRSQQVDRGLLDKADCVIAMTTSHAEMLKRLAAGEVGEVALMCDYIDASEGLAGADIPDPIGMGMEAYEEVAEVMSLALPGIINAVKDC